MKLKDIYNLSRNQQSESLSKAIQIIYTLSIHGKVKQKTLKKCLKYFDLSLIKYTLNNYIDNNTVPSL